MKKTDVFLEDLLKRHPKEFDNILQNRDAYRVQIIYTQIDRSKNNNPSFKKYYFNVDTGQYFYPASTIKMPVALLALQKLKRIRKHGVSRGSPMITETRHGSQTAVYNDPTSPDGRPSVSHYIKKIFLVSDNDASNRLYEFLGQEYLNKQLQKKGLTTAEISHRLAISLTEEENRHTNPVKFLNDTGTVAHAQRGQRSSFTFQKRNVLLGNGYISDGKLVDKPFDFSKKNQIALDDLQVILQSVVFPSSVRKENRINITDDDRKFVLQYMSQYPSETSYPSYDTSIYPDGYCKFLLWGSPKGTLPKHIRVFNKVGNAYGFLTDIAYIVDLEKKLEFMLSATIYCNSDGIFNDDQYDYETLGLPFMKNLGEIIYNHESTRPRKYLPDLTEFKMMYEK